MLTRPGVRSADAVLFPLAAAWISFLILLIGGVPLFFVPRHLGWLCVQVVAPLAGICGVLFAPALIASASSFWADYLRNFNGQTVVWGLAYGASVGAAFCAIAGIGFSVPQARIPRI